MFTYELITDNSIDADKVKFLIKNYALLKFLEAKKNK